MNSITFTVSQVKELEPSTFTYGIVIESENPGEVIPDVEKIIQVSSGVTQLEIPNHQYTLPEKADEQFTIYMFIIEGRDALEAFTHRLATISGIRGGIISNTISDEDEQELRLIEALTEKAKAKALQYARFCGKKAGEIISFKVENNPRGNWVAYPPIKRLDRDSIYHGIVMQYDKKDMYVLNRTIEVAFELI